MTENKMTEHTSQHTEPKKKRKRIKKQNAKLVYTTTTSKRILGADK
jgi:hypothetical protein